VLAQSAATHGSTVERHLRKESGAPSLPTLSRPYSNRRSSMPWTNASFVDDVPEIVSKRSVGIVSFET